MPRYNNLYVDLIKILKNIRYVSDISDRSSKEFAVLPALVHNNESISYRDLGIIIYSYIKLLKKLISSEKCRIAIALPNSPQFIISFFTILKIKSCAVLINPNLSLAEINKNCFASKIDLMITTRSLIEKLKNYKYLSKISYLGYEDDSVYLPTYKSIRFQNEVNNFISDDEAVVVFTTGVTGRTKGVLLTNKNILSNIKATIKPLSGIKQDIVLTGNPICHVAGLRFVLTYLCLGATIHLFPVTILADYINYYIDINKITAFSASPYLLSLMIQRGAGSRKYPMRSIRIITSGGGNMSKNLRKKIIKAFPWALFFSLYGLSEATSIVSYLPPKFALLKPVSVGRVISNTKFKIIKEKNNLFGELLIKGPGIMKGYVDGAKATSEVITKDGWLRTGDLVRADDDNHLTIVGRKKEVIIKSGLNISPIEVEDVLLSHDKVMDASVIGIDTGDKGEEIVAFLVKKHTSIKEKEIYSYCLKYLDPSKVPGKIFFISKIPRFQNGKIDKIKLKDKYFSILKGA